MSQLITIAITDVVFTGHHGLYPEEQIVGNEFKVDLWVSYRPQINVINSINDTINYASLYAIIKEEMKTVYQLLETFLMEVSEKIYKLYPEVEKIEIAIVKLHAPISEFAGKVGVSYTKIYV